MNIAIFRSFNLWLIFLFRSVSIPPILFWIQLMRSKENPIKKIWVETRLFPMDSLILSAFSFTRPEGMPSMISSTVAPQAAPTGRAFLAYRKYLRPKKKV
jgi:hypothetical protein